MNSTLNSNDREYSASVSFKIWDASTILYKLSIFILVNFLMLLTLLEVKRYYNIDVLPNYDSSVDDAYGALRGTLSETFFTE